MRRKNIESTLNIAERNMRADPEDPSLVVRYIQALNYSGEHKELGEIEENDYRSLIWHIVNEGTDLTEELSVHSLAAPVFRYILNNRIWENDGIQDTWEIEPINLATLLMHLDCSNQSKDAIVGMIINQSWREWSIYYGDPIVRFIMEVIHGDGNINYETPSHNCKIIEYIKSLSQQRKNLVIDGFLSFMKDPVLDPYPRSPRHGEINLSVPILSTLLKEDVNSILIPLLENSDDSIVSTAIQYLGIEENLDDQKIIDILEYTLMSKGLPAEDYDVDWNPQLNAIEALGDIGNENSAQIIIPFFENFVSMSDYHEQHLLEAAEEAIRKIRERG
jgi:hypothetical protein